MRRFRIAAAALLACIGVLYQLAGVSGDSDAGKTQSSPADPFLFWLDYPGSQEYTKLQPQW